MVRRGIQLAHDPVRVPGNAVAGGRNCHLPLYFVLLKAWTAVFGDSVAAMRGLNVPLAGATIVGVYLFTVEALRPGPAAPSDRGEADARWTGLLAAALVALSLRQILATWDARMYALGTALSAFSAWTLMRALRSEEQSWGHWAAHVVPTTLLAYTHPFALFTVAAQVIFLAAYFAIGSRTDVLRLGRDRRFLACVGAYLAVGVLWALWLPTMLKQVHRVEDHFWTSPLTGRDVLHRCYEMFLEDNASLSADLAAIGVCVAVVCSLAFRGTPGRWLTASLVVVPFAGGAVASALGSNVFLPRYLVFAQVFLLVGVADVIGWARVRPIRNWAAAALLGGGIVVCWDTWITLDPGKYPGVRGAVQYVEARWGKSDQLIVGSSWLYFPALYHCHDRGRCRAYSDGLPFGDDTGGPIAIKADVIRGREMRRLSGGHAWIICRDREGKDVIPSNWTCVGREVIPEASAYGGDLQVIEYSVPTRGGP
jgi:mannosyltransferase